MVCRTKDREAQRNFIANHAGFAPIFTADEVKRLNANRPPNDQLELMRKPPLSYPRSSFLFMCCLISIILLI
jgi:hypothetical protein